MLKAAFSHALDRPTLHRPARRLLLPALLLCTLLILASAAARARRSRHQQESIALHDAVLKAMAAAPPLPLSVRQRCAAATATGTRRHPLVKAMRIWRRGIPTLVLTDASGAELAAEADEGQQWGELWQHYPDFRRSPTGKPADPRAAAAVALALEALSGSGRAANGSAADVAGGPGFDWLIYGDDDVAFMWPGLLSMLEGLDPQQPYFLTDDLWSWWPRGIDPKKQWQTAPRADQPRCLPCSFNDAGLDLAATHAFKTCNCTVAAMADAFGQLLAPSADWLDFPAHPPYMSMDGGGGAVISIGLLRRLNATQYGRCIRGETGRTEVYGSDGLVTECVWQQGFGITDPGYELHHRGSFLFNAGGPQTSWKTLAAEAESALQGSGGRGVSTQQQERLLHMVSKHTDGGAMHNHREEAAHVARFLASMAQHAQRFSPPLEQLAKRLKP